MIAFREIKEKSLEWGVPIETVDKDWVLGHYLNGLYGREFFQEYFCFKGGTCLRKLHFPDFRFSEDLDFSALEGADKDKIKTELEIVHDAVYQNIGILFGPIQIKEQQSNDQLMGYEFKIPFYGAKHRNKIVPPERWRTSIKIDISLRETLLFPPILKKIFHSYSDVNDITTEVPGYNIVEIFAEKLRSLIQRGFPRDYYDLWYLSNFYNENMDYTEIIPAFKKKCEIKGIDFQGVEYFFQGKCIENENWQSSLGSHLRELPSVDKVLQELRIKLENIFNENIF